MFAEKELAANLRFAISMLDEEIDKLDQGRPTLITPMISVHLKEMRIKKQHELNELRARSIFVD